LDVSPQSDEVDEVKVLIDELRTELVVRFEVVVETDEDTLEDSVELVERPSVELVSVDEYVEVLELSIVLELVEVATLDSIEVKELEVLESVLLC
jgi:hypothetical protein